MSKKYQIIYADPPWVYRDKASAGFRGACYNYKVQNDSWICNLDIEGIVDDNCILFLWVTMPKLPIAFDVIKAWGFTYKTCAFTWIKVNKKADTLFFGMGNWTHGNAELCLLATKGKPKRVNKAIFSVVQSRIRKHSQKPDEVRERIVELMGDLPRIELFACERVEGWDVWGNEVYSDIELYPKLDGMSDDELRNFLGSYDD
jgi:site-specific DNA-methyltransferase (adenine-specific)